MNLLKVGIIGAGAMGKMHSAVYSYIKNVEVTAISDNKPDKAKEIAFNINTVIYNSVEDLIKNSGVDVIDICLPTAFHKKYTVMAALKGIHVLCEKPMALNIEDTKVMIYAAKSAGIILMIGHCLRFSKPYNLLKEFMASKKYGELLSLNLYRHSPKPLWSEGNWITDQMKSGGLAMDLHIHDVDMIFYLLGKPQSVVSSGNNVIFSTLYEYPNKNVYSEASWRPQSGYHLKMGYDAIFEGASVIYGDNKITIYEGDKEPVEVDEFQQAVLNNNNIANLQDRFVYIYLNEIEYFLECIKDGSKPLILMPEDSMEALRITINEIESSLMHEKKYI